MAIASNLYAEKVFAEHPTSLWSLDENIDYISYISETQRNLESQWTIVNGAASTALPSTAPNPPFLNSQMSQLIGIPYTSFNEVLALSSELFNTLQIDQAKETFTIGSYIYADHPYVTGYEIGYQYTDQSDNVKQISKFFNSTVNKEWVFISETFKIPTLIADIKVFIKARYSLDPDNPLTAYSFFINGITVGQWTEQFNTISLGIPNDEIVDTSTLFPSGAGNFGIKAFAYGEPDSEGYYICSSNELYATNTSIPMVFGSSSLTKLTPNPNGPSLVIPGTGVLNESGRYQEYTLEAWIRLQSFTNELRRIIGPLGSDDGVYVNGPFMTLVIGSSVSSFFVGELFRPMLLDLKIGINYASLSINGEQVISIDFDTASLILPEPSLDWIGFYAYDDVPSVEIDVVGIYSYQVPSILLKRRFGFGQAVESPEGVNRAYGGVAALIDYRFADYTNNYSYPNIGKFSQGISENLITENGRISAPTYSPPEIIMQSGSSQEWEESQFVADNNTNSYLEFETSNPGYLYLDSFNLAFQSIAGIYGVFEIDSYSEEDRLLYVIENRSTNSGVYVSLKNDSVYYRFRFWGEDRTLYYKSGTVIGTKFFSGIDVEDLSTFFGSDIQAFFANASQLRLYIANDKDFSSQFNGKIYSFGICTSRNLASIKDSFDNLEVDSLELTADPGDIYFGNNNEFWQYFLDGGRVTSFNVDEVSDHIASYTIISKSNFGKTYLDVATSSYWEDYIPLTYFSQYVKDIFDNDYYDLDFIQFNVGYPALKKFKGAFYNTDDQIVKTYITFQYISSGANAQYSYFTNTQPMPKNGVVEPVDGWINTKYEVVDGAIIYPPKDVDRSLLAIVTHIEMDVSGIRTNPMAIRRIEYASQAFNDFTANPVGTKFGVQLFPYTQYASFFDYKARNPFKIYKGSSPHLYLTKDSGINRVGDSSPITFRGLSIPINPSAAEEYRVIAMQMFLLYNKDSISSQATQLFEITGTDKSLIFYIKANDKTGKRGRIYAINSNTGTTEDGLAFYINGKLVREPVISLDEWTSIGVSFATTFSFDEYPGAIRILDSVLFNNISYYESTNLQEIERQSNRSWSRIKTEYESWIDVLRGSLTGNFLWNDVLVISSVSFFGINPGDIYNSYIGTNKIIADGIRNLTIGNAEYKIYADIDWFTSVYTPV